MTQLPYPALMVHVPGPGVAETTTDVAPITGEPTEPTVIVVLAVPATTAGFAGAAIGVTLSDTDDNADSSVAFTPFALNVYADPFVRPDTVHEPDAPLIVHVSPVPTADTTTDVAPLTTDTDTTTDALAATTPGVTGTANGVAASDATDTDESPPAFRPTAVNVYAVPFVKPLTTQLPDDAAIVHVPEPGLADTTTDVAPTTTDATDTVAEPLTTTTEGLPGTAIGVTLSDTDDNADSFVAFTPFALNVYADPFVRPDTVHEPDAPLIVHVSPVPTADTTTDVAPLTTDTDTTTDALAATTPGVTGTANGVAASDATDTDESPPAFRPTAVNVYAVPFVKPLTTQLPDDAAIVHVPEPGLADTTTDVAPTTTDATVTVAVDEPLTTTDGFTGTAIGVALSDVRAAESPLGLRPTAVNT